MFTDDRGEIRDLLVRQIDSVTRIWTRQGAVRGNHYHRLTTQWTLVIDGRLEVVTDTGRGYLNPDSPLWMDLPMMGHAWRACMDTTALVFTSGPRSGPGYASDTYKLDTPLIVP